MNDPNVLNNPALFNYINQMQVSQSMQVNQSMPGFGPWNNPNQPDMYGFGSLPNTTPQQVFDRQRLIDTPPTTSQSPDVEIVPETQVQEEDDTGAGSSQRRKKRVHKKKVGDEPRLKTKAIPWTDDEQMNLAKAWLEVTEDPMYGNYQKEKTYWKKITKVFRDLEKKGADCRDQDGVGAKWRKMRAQIQAFNQIYTRHSNANNHPSGVNDTIIQQRALAEYQGTHLKSFTYLDIWDYLKRSSKFSLVVDFDEKVTRGQPSAKRSKTSSSVDPQIQGSDARCIFDLNTTEDEGERFIRPSGRDAAKKGTSSGSVGRVDYTEAFEKVTSKLDGLMEISKKRVDLGERRLRLKESKQKAEDLKVLSTDYSHLDRPERALAEQMKQEIREKYGL